MTNTGDTARGIAQSITDLRTSEATELDYLRQLHLIAGAVDDLIAGSVAVSRQEGETWAEIGRALGSISKQAVQQRFSAA